MVARVVAMAAALEMAGMAVTVAMAVSAAVLRAWVMEAAQEVIVGVPPGLRVHHSTLATTVASAVTMAAVAAIS